MRKNNLHEKQELPYIIINVQFGCIKKYLHIFIRLSLHKTNPTTMIIMMTIEPIIAKYISAESLLFSLKKMQLTC